MACLFTYRKPLILLLNDEIKTVSSLASFPLLFTIVYSFINAPSSSNSVLMQHQDQILSHRCSFITAEGNFDYIFCPRSSLHGALL